MGGSSRTRPKLFTCLLLAVLKTSVTALINCTDNNHSFTCWLHLLSIFVPDQSFHKGIFSIHTNDIVCTDFRLSHIESFRYDQEDGSQHNNTLSDADSIRVTLVDVEAKCSGEYRVGITTGSVSLQVITRQELYEDNFNYLENNSSALMFDTCIQSSTIFMNNAPDDLTPMIPMTPIAIPFYANATFCRANFEVPSNGIVFSGSISAHIVEMFSHRIGKHVEQELNFISCDSIQNAAMSHLNDNLIRFQTWFQRFVMDNLFYIKRQVQDTDELEVKRHDDIVANDLLKWIDMTFIQRTIHRISHIINHHLEKGLLLSLLDRFHWVLDPSECQNDCGFFFHGVNGFIRYLMQSSNNSIPSLNITHYLPNSLRSIDYMMPHLGNVSIYIHDLLCEGFDTIQYFDIDTPNSNEGLHVSPKFSLDFLRCLLDVNLVVVPESITYGGRIQDFALNENFTVSFNVSDVTVDSVIDFAISKERLQNITVFDVIGFNKTFINWDALIGSIYHLEIANLNIDLVTDCIVIQGISSEDDLEASLDELFDNIFDLTVDRYGLMITEMIKATFHGPIRRSANKWINSRLLLGDTLKEGVIANNVHDEFYHFNESSSVAKLREFVSSADVLNNLNSYTSCLSSYMKSSKYVPESIHRSLIYLEKLYMDAIHVNSINLISEDISHLSCGIDLNDDQSALLRIAGAIDYLKNDFNLAFNLTVQLGSISSYFGSNILYNIASYENLTLLKIISDPSYLLYPMLKSSGLYGFQSDIKEVDVDIVGSISNLESTREIKFQSTNSTSLGLHVSAFINEMVDLIQSIVNGFIDIYLDSNSKTKSTADSSLLKVDLENQPSQSLLLLYICLGVVFLSMNFYYYFTHGECWNPELVHESRKVAFARQIHPRRRNSMSSILFHKRTPDCLRIIVPVTILSTILVFVLSNFEVGATVDIQISKDGSIPVLFVPGVTAFSLGKTVRDMFHAKVYILMSLVLIFSGIWPYVKLLLMLFSFTIPQSRFSVRRRESLLIWLDAMGKYSLVDSFVLVLMLVSFRFNLEFPEIGVVDSYVTPYFGFYLFLTGTVLSLVIGHIVTFLHRYSYLRQISDNQPTTKISIRNHSFQARDYYGYAQSVKFTSMASSIWFFLITASVILILVGSTNEFLVFEFQGIVGHIMGRKQTAQFSLISLGTSLSSSVKDPEHFGIRLIQCTYFFFSIFMPCMGLLSLFILTYASMSLRNLQRLFFIAEICNAWSAVEVFLLSVVVSMLELHQFSNFMVGDKCNFLQHPFARQLFNDETDCFGVKSSVGTGIIYLCTGVLLSRFVTHVGLEICRTALKERISFETLRQNEMDNDIVLRFIEEELDHGNITDVSLVEQIMKYRYIGRLLVQSQPCHE